MRYLPLFATLAATALLVSLGNPVAAQAQPRAAADAVRPIAAKTQRLGASDFIKASGNVLKTSSGKGSTINLRGTNVGGWLTQEDWMSPLGEFAVDRTGWSISASTGGAAAAAKAIDGSGTTRWTTTANQDGTQWLRLDLGANTVFNRLSIDNSNNPGQYPRSLNVQTSTDGATWTSVAAQPGADGVITAEFAPQVARYVRVDETGTAAAPWSVGEINLFSDPTLNTSTFIAAASSTAPGTAPSAALDGNASTLWQSGAAQQPGQSFTIDFGHNVGATKVLLDAGAATADDYPRTWEMFTSNDNINFNSVASGYGTNRIIDADLHGNQNMRYLKIVSNGTSDHWWSIAELAFYNGINLDRSKWVVTSTVGDSPANVIDGDVNTRWTTGAAPTPGQLIQVDLGALVTLNNVAMQTAAGSNDTGDYPRGYQLQLSRDGSTWTTAATGAGTTQATTIGFPAQAVRYFKLTETATAPQWWSIGELTAGLYNDDYSLNNTITARFGVTGAQSIIDTHQDTWLQNSDLDKIAAAGLNFIRVPIGWNTFLNLDGTWKADPWRELDWIIKGASQRGVYVLLDLHTVPGGAGSWGSYGRYGPSPNGFWGNPIDQNWTEDIWHAMAARYKGNPGVAGYDLMNEPQIEGSENAADQKVKNDLYNRLYRAVRAVDPNHLIVMGAFPGLDSIAHPSTYGWTNVMYELHPYDMSSPKDWTAQNQLVTNELAALPGRMSDYGVPFLEGEYSLYYNDDVWARFMAGLNAASVSWSSWTYKVTGAATGGNAYWGMYYDNSKPQPIINSDNGATFVAKLRQFSTSNFTENTELVSTVRKYSGGLATFAPVEIDQSGWSATASATAANSTPSAGIDGPGNASWYSGQSQAGGEWYQIDMGAANTVAMVTVQISPYSSWDYPRGFTLQLSTDGTQWTTAATGAAYGWKRPISIAPTTARYIRITQTGAATQWWSIDDVTVDSSY